MSEWQRTTRLCSSIALQPAHLEAIRAHITEHELGNVEAQALVCFETDSLRTGKVGLFARLIGLDAKAMVQSIIVTPTRLIFALQMDDDPPAATSELLAKLEVADYEKSPEYALMPDHGVKVQGIQAQGGTVGTVFFGLGEGADADHARMVFKQAVRAAHGEGPPVERDQP